MVPTTCLPDGLTGEALNLRARWDDASDLNNFLALLVSNSPASGKSAPRKIRLGTESDRLVTRKLFLALQDEFNTYHYHCKRFTAKSSSRTCDLSLGGLWRYADGSISMHQTFSGRCLSSNGMPSHEYGHSKFFCFCNNSTMPVLIPIAKPFGGTQTRIWSRSGSTNISLACIKRTESIVGFSSPAIPVFQRY